MPALKPLRLWPGVTLAVLQLLSWFVLPKVFPDDPFYGFFGFLIGALLIVIWWLFLSRAPWSDRLGAIFLAAIALYATSRFTHVSVAKLGMGNLFVMLAPAALTFVFVVALAVSQALSVQARRMVMCAAIVLGSGAWGFVRASGIGGSAGFNFAWRWSMNPEERLLA
ncbi:MAG: hypothetical protein HY046_14110, partial [Acidobacteria bacterium]|nr:hypothetical protein [Acidobacteriota bacterium]